MEYSISLYDDIINTSFRKVKSFETDSFWGKSLFPAFFDIFPRPQLTMHIPNTKMMRSGIVCVHHLAIVDRPSHHIILLITSFLLFFLRKTAFVFSHALIHVCSLFSAAEWTLPTQNITDNSAAGWVTCFGLHVSVAERASEQASLPSSSCMAAPAAHLSISGASVPFNPLCMETKHGILRERLNSLWASPYHDRVSVHRSNLGLDDGCSRTGHNLIRDINNGQWSHFRYLSLSLTLVLCDMELRILCIGTVWRTCIWGIRIENITMLMQKLTYMLKSRYTLFFIDETSQAAKTCYLFLWERRIIRWSMYDVQRRSAHPMENIGKREGIWYSPQWSIFIPPFLSLHVY